SPQDAIVLRAPSWWNLRHTLWLLGITMSGLLLVMAWVVVLGGRLREQMSMLRQKLQHGAVLEERNRIARELHDSLEQELAGISMQLDLAADCFQQAPQIAHQAVQTARNMSRHSMIEARRSVWDLRCHLLEKGDLGSALAEIVQPLLARNGSKIEMRITGRRVRLPGSMEMNLLRIGQEAVANAVQHGHARKIEISLDYAGYAVRLSVSDDGCGFRADQSASTGHFGLLDMRERAHSMGSSLRVESQPGQGAKIAVEVFVKGQ
ncbi:MAG: sensor histidine kinase, partial [Acidobacteriia bacterium]|nr:sensor histidine kinase [Terriglobia bacterium]